MTPTEFGQFDFSSPDEPTEAPAPSFGKFDFSSGVAPDEEPGDASVYSFDTLLSQLKPITRNPSDSFNWFMGQAAQTGRRIGWLQEQAADLFGSAAKNLIPGEAEDEVVDTIYGAQEALAQKVQQRSKESSDYWLDQVGEEFKIKAEAGLDDPEFGLTTLYAAALGSLPEMMMTMGSGAVAGKLTQMAGTVGFARIAAAAENGSPLASKMLAYSKYAPAVAGAAVGGATEGALAAGATGVAMEERVNAMSHEELIEGSERYRDVYDSAMGMTEDQRRLYAKQTVAEELGRTTASWVGIATSALGAPLGAAAGYLGGRAAGAASVGGVVKKLEGTVAGQAATGFAAEGAQEFLQEGSQQFLTNLGLREYVNPKQGLSEGVLDNAVIGGLVGGIMGGSITPLVGAGARGEAKAKKAVDEVTGMGEAKFSRNPILEARIVEQIKQLESAGVPAREFQQVARWAGNTADGGRSALEFSKALEELLETGKAPENVAAMVGDDFDDDGMLTEAAYTKDKARLAFDVEMRIKPQNDEELAKVVDALAAGGANPYRMSDGTLVVPQSAPGAAGLQAVANSIQRQTGATVEIVSNEVDQGTEGAGTEVAAQAQDAEAAGSAEAEGVLSEEQIVNPIPRDASPEEKLEAIRKLTAENKPLVDAFLADLDAKIGTKSKSSIKEDAKILEKASRPSILKNKPWHNVEHVRDTLRFKTVLDSPAQIEQIAEKVKEQGWEVVKVDTEKLTKPKDFGWRFVGIDLRMPNGQLVEYYMPLAELEEAKKTPLGHAIFEKWRNRDMKSLSEEELREFDADLTASSNNYTQAFQASLARSGLSESDAVASAAKFSATFGSTGPSVSMKSSAVKSSPRDQTPSRLEATKSSPITATSDKSSDAETRIATSSEDVGGEETVAQVDAPRKHVTVRDAEGLEAMGLTAASHPDNDYTEPTERQLRAGNYPKGHGVLKGTEAREDIPVSIENVPGSIRRGLDAKWSRKMKHWYGYIRGTKHVGDGKLDVYIGKKAHDPTLPVFVVHQNNVDGTFDEPKVLMGYKSDGEAKAAYLSEYPANLGPKLFGGITRLSRSQFADYIESGRTDVPPNPMTKQPMTDLRPAQFSVAMAEAKGTTDKPVRLADFYSDPRKAFTAPGWAVITATRESAGDFGSVANLESNRDLERNLRERRIRFVEVKGSYQGVDQGKNYLIIANERTAIELGAFYGQESILTNRGLVYMDGRLTPAVHGQDIIGPSAKKEDFFSVLPSGTAFSLGLDFDATGTDPKPRVADEETVASVTYKGKRKVEAGTATEEARARAPGLLSLRKEAEPTSRARTTYEDAVKIVNRTVAGLKGAPEVVVHTGESDLPNHLRNQIIEHGAQGLIEGLYDPMDGKVHIIPKNVQLREGETFSDAVQRILTEESMGHFGLDAVFGQRALNALHDIVWADAKATPRMKAIVKEYSGVYGDITDKATQRRMANEYLAKFGEEQRPTLWQKMVVWMRDALRSMGLTREWSDNDLKVLMDRVFNAVRTGQVPTSLKKLNTALLQQDSDDVVTTSVKDGKALRHVEFDGPTRRISAETYRATMQDGMESGMPAADVSSFSGTLRDFAEFVAEEGKRVIVAPESVITAEMAEGFESRVDEGARIVRIPDEMVHAQRKATEAQYSLRNRTKGSADVEAILAKTLQEHVGELSFGQRMNQWFREMTGILGETDTYLELKTGWIDSAAAIERLERGQFDGKLLDASESAYKMVSLTKNLPQLMAAVSKVGVPQFKDGTFVRVQGRKGLYEIFTPLFRTSDGKNLLHLWEGYAVARRSSQLIEQTNPDGTLKEKLLNRQEIETLLNLEREYPQFRKVFDEWQEFNRQLLELAVDRGALSREMADLWMKNDYVPFYRVDDVEEENVGGITRKRGLSGQRVTSKRLTGSDKRIQPVLENVMFNTASILEKVYKNEAMNRIVALADGVAMTREPLRVEAVKMTNEDLARALKKSGLFVGDDSNSTPLQRKAGKLLRDNDIDYAVRAVESMTPEQREAWTTLFRRVRPDGKDVVSVMVAGKPVYYRVHDPLLLRAIMDMTPTNFGALVDFMGGAKRLLTTMVTLDPGFMMANWLRDTLSSWVVVDEKFRPFRDAPKGAAEIWTESGMALDLAMAGGMTGGFYDPTQDFADVVNEVTDPGVTVLNSPKKLLDAYRRIGMVSEQVNRMAIAKAVLRRGGSLAEAAYQAQDVLNFSQSGDAVAAQLLIRTVPFLNARIQGLYRLWKGARGMDGRDPAKARMAFLLKGLFLAGISMLLSLRNMDDERYERLPDFQKDTYWHFFIGGDHYAIPKPFEVGVLFSTIPERAMRLVSGSDTGRTTAKSISRALGDTFAFNPIPQLFKPIVEQWANRSFFTDRPIVGLELEGLEPQAQYNPWTSETARALTGVIDAVVPDGMQRFTPETLRSPTRMEHAMRAYMGTVGAYLFQLSDAALRGAGVFPDAPAAGSIRDLPVVGGAAGRFVRGDPDLSSASKYADDLYDALARADDAYRTLHAYMRQGNLEAAEELADRRLNELSVRPILHDFREAAAEINTQQRFIMQSDLSPEEKRKALDELTRTKNEIMKESVPYLALLGY